MKRFREYFSEAGFNVPVISIDKNEVDLNDINTVNEINRNLSITLGRDFGQVGEAVNSVRKILSMYGIEMPQLDIKNDNSGTFNVPISQFKTSGENHFNVTPPFSEKNEYHNLVFKFTLKDGKYDVQAEIIKK